MQVTGSTRKMHSITDEPIIWRYFVAPLSSMMKNLQLDEKEFVARAVMRINTEFGGAYVFSSGKNMGTFNYSAATISKVSVISALPFKSA